MRPNGHELLQITDVEDDAVVPDWSLDGRRIVFVAQRCEYYVERIWSMDLQGGHRHMIAPTPAELYAIDPNVTPDGTA